MSRANSSSSPTVMKMGKCWTQQPRAKPDAERADVEDGQDAFGHRGIEKVIPGMRRDDVSANGGEEQGVTTRGLQADARRQQALNRHRPRLMVMGRAGRQWQRQV